MFVQILLLLVFFAVTIFVGLYFRKRSSNVNDFVLGGRNVGPWLSAFSYGVTYFSAVVFVGYAGQFGWRFGSAAIWIGLGNAFIGSMAAWLVLGRRTRLMSHHLKAATMPAFFGTRYFSQALKIAAALIVFIFLIPYTASLYNGLSRLFEMAFNIDFKYCIIAMGVLTAIFVVAGGYLATVVNDLIQGTIQLVGIVAVVIVAINSKGGLFAAFNGLSEVSDPAAGIAAGGFTSIFGPDPVSLIGVLILTSLGTWGLPQMVARFYSIKSEKMIPKGAIVSTIFALFVAGGCYFLGSFGRLWTDSLVAEGIPLGKFDEIIPHILSGMGEVMIGVVIVLVFAASISTLSSLVMASASTLTLDFLKGHVVKKMDGKRQLLVIRGLIVVFIIISSSIAIMQINGVFKGNLRFIADLMGVSWGALAGSFLAPFLYGLYWKRASTVSVWCCFIFSTSLMILNTFFRSSFPSILQSPINAGAFCMLAGLVIVPLVSAFTKVKDKAAVEEHFSCYEKAKLPERTA
ncbi:MAG: sodium:solute symporter family protein [Clostridiales bacterium]|nr:sodium:solute symporter family protein [Clostridiales bacterium]